MSASRYLAVVLVRDLPASVAFYRDALGLRVHDDGHPQWAELWCGDQLLALWTGEGQDAAILPQGAEPGLCGSTFVALKVDDLDRARAAVEAGGGRLDSEVRHADHGRMALVRDPDGTPLLLHCPDRPLPGW